MSMNFSPCHPFLITLIRSVQSQLTGLLEADIFQDGLKYKAALAYGGDGVQTAFKLSSRQFPCVFLNRVVDQVLESCPLQPYCELLYIYPQIQRSFLVVSNFKE